jgi:hypothetical protein
VRPRTAPAFEHAKDREFEIDPDAVARVFATLRGDPEAPPTLTALTART